MHSRRIARADHDFQSQHLGRHPDVRQLQHLTGLTPKQIEFGQRCLHLREVSAMHHYWAVQLQGHGRAFRAPAGLTHVWAQLTWHLQEVGNTHCTEFDLASRQD